MSRAARIDLGGSALEVLTRTQGEQRALVQQAVVSVMRRQSLIMAGHIVSTQLSGGDPVSPSRNPNKKAKKRRTGNLARSITGRSVLEGGLPVLQIGVFRQLASRYAPVQEFGTKRFNSSSPFGTIRPKRSKYLTVAVGDAVTPAGVEKYRPRQAPEPLKPIIFKKPNKNVAGMLAFKSSYNKELERSRLEERPFDMRNVEAVFLLLTKMEIRPGLFILDGSLDYLPRLSEAITQAIGSTT